MRCNSYFVHSVKRETRWIQVKEICQICDFPHQKKHQHTNFKTIWCVTNICYKLCDMSTSSWPMKTTFKWYFTAIYWKCVILEECTPFFLLTCKHSQRKYKWTKLKLLSHKMHSVTTTSEIQELFLIHHLQNTFFNFKTLSSKPLNTHSKQNDCKILRKPYCHI